VKVSGPELAPGALVGAYNLLVHRVLPEPLHVVTNPLAPGRWSAGPRAAALASTAVATSVAGSGLAELRPRSFGRRSAILSPDRAS
jgi:hypothetical protein